MGFRYLFLTHHAGILLSHPGVGYLYPSPRLCLRQRYPTLPNYLFMTTTTTVQLNKLPVITIVFRIIDGTIGLNNTKIQIHALVQYVSVVTASNETLTFYFRFEMPNIYYF